MMSRPKHWQEFEDLTLSALTLKWNSPGLQKNGRPGQQQHGVDIYGTDDLGRVTGIQCKRCAGPLKIETVEDEVKNAEAFDGALATLYVATTADADANLQKVVRALSESRSRKRQFAVGLIFWEDIVNGLARDHTILAGHYPLLKLDSVNLGPTDASKKIAALNLGYFGRHLLEFFDLTFGEIGEMCGTDPYEFQGILRILQSSLAILHAADRNALSAWLAEIDTMAFTTGQNVDHALCATRVRRVADRIRVLPSLPNLAYANFVELGGTLGGINHADRFTPTMRERVFRQIAALFPAATTRLRERMSQLQDTAAYNAGPILFTFVDAELRWGDASGARPDPEPIQSQPVVGSQ